MDEEDLREHRSSHRTMATKGDFAAAGSRDGRSGASCDSDGRRPATLPAGGLPKELEEDFFGSRTPSLGARLFQAAQSSDSKGPDNQSQTVEEATQALHHTAETA